MDNKPKVYTIIVAYNGVNWLQKCIDSLLASSFITQIIVVDNCSVDSTLSLLSSEYTDKIQVIKNTANVGFGQANNIGISFALKNNADFVFLLNQDAFVQDNTIDKLLDLAIQNPTYGVISPIQLNYEGDDLEQYFKYFIQKNAAVEMFTDVLLRKNIKSVYQVPFVQAALWFIPAKIFIEIGGFDPIFFHYGEDNNFCQRVLFHEYNIGIASDIFAYHQGTKIMDNSSIENFSVLYFLSLEKKLKMYYADINFCLTPNIIKIAKIKLVKSIVKSILKLNLVNAVGYYKEFKVTSSSFTSILISRIINKKPGSHYLNIAL